MAHILVVDDDADLRQLLLTALERDGHQVTALDRGSAVTEAHCRWAHCILLDVMMPGEDGFATCQRVRALADCPILFLTAKTEEADVIVIGAGMAAMCAVDEAIHQGQNVLVIDKAPFGFGGASGMNWDVCSI